MRFPDFQHCQFIVSERGEVLSHELHFEDWLGNRSNPIKGSHFIKLLLDINPNWKGVLPEQLALLPVSLFLPWESGDSTPLFGLNLSSVEYDNIHYVTLRPELSNDWIPHAETQNETESSESLRRLALRAIHAETRLETYMANFPGTFFSQRPDLSFSYLGEGAQDMLFLDPEPLYKNGGLFLNSLSVEDQDPFVDALRSNSGTSGRFSITYQVRDSNSSEVRHLLDVRTPQLTPSGILLGYDGVWLDVTRQAIAENRLSDTVWKENLTHLTNGLAHDFGNLMAGIYSVSDVQLGNVSAEDPMHDLLTHIKTSSMQAQKLVRRILDLHKDKDKTEKTYHNLCDLIEEQLDLCKILVAHTTSIELTIPEQKFPVHIDESAFRQTILNLTVNARDAMGPEGRIQITLRPVEAGDEMSCIESNPIGPAPTKGVVLDFADTGLGIHPDILGKIFQPFFSTKEKGKGSGFGLYNARIFASNHGGKIGVTSIPNQGTTFHIYLPVLEG